VKVALSGDGGDELFGGYTLFFNVENQKKFDRLPGLLRKAVSAIADRLPYSAYGKNYLRMLSRPTGLDRFLAHRGLPYFLSRQFAAARVDASGRGGFFAPRIAGLFFARRRDVLSQAFYFETKATLAGDMLVKVDRMSMAASLEVRSPLLDHELAELAMSIPPDLKMRNGRGKAIFLDAVGDRLPPKLLTLPKKGFGVPLAKWYRTSLKTFLWDHFVEP